MDSAKAVAHVSPLSESSSERSLAIFTAKRTVYTPQSYPFPCFGAGTVTISAALSNVCQIGGVRCQKDAITNNVTNLFFINPENFSANSLDEE